VLASYEIRLTGEETPHKEGQVCWSFGDSGVVCKQVCC